MSEGKTKDTEDIQSAADRLIPRPEKGCTGKPFWYADKEVAYFTYQGIYEILFGCRKCRLEPGLENSSVIQQKNGSVLPRQANQGEYEYP